MTNFTRMILAATVLAASGILAADAPAKLPKPDVPALMEKPNELMEIAQSAYADGNTQIALDKFREAHKAYEMLEATNPVFAATSDFQPIRFRKAICETEIDRILLEEAEATARTVAVTDTSELAKKRAERLAKAKQEKQPDTAEELAAKQGKVKDEAAARAASQEAAAARAAEAEPPPAKPAAKGQPDSKGQPAAKPVNAAAELGWAKDCLQIEHFDDAETALLKVLKADPSNPAAMLLMAQLRLRQGRFEDASVVLDDMLADAPDDEPALLLAAAAETAAGAYNKAMAHLDHAVKVNPKRPDGYLDMSWLLLEMDPKETVQADLYYRQAVKLGADRDKELEKRLGIKP